MHVPGQTPTKIEMKLVGLPWGCRDSVHKGLIVRTGILFVRTFCFSFAEAHCIVVLVWVGFKARWLICGMDGTSGTDSLSVWHKADQKGDRQHSGR